jgi:predicted ATPase
MSFEAANQFGYDLKKLYFNLGYQVIDVPFDTPEIRAKFILKMVLDCTRGNHKS